MTRRRDNLTGDLLTWEPPKVEVGYGEEVSGRGSLDNRIARVVSEALRDAKASASLQRADVARRMSDFLGRTVSEDMLNKWASEASQHRIPLDAFVALIEVTGSVGPLNFVPKYFGYAVVPEKYRDIIELHLIEEHEREVDQRKAALVAKLRGL